MIKLVRILLITALMLTAVFSVTAQAADKDIYEFGNVAEYNGEVYAYNMYYEEILDGNVSVKELPYALRNRYSGYPIETIISFCIYNEKIYYMEGTFGEMDALPVSIYACDLDGSNNVLIAENTNSHSSIFTINNELYYSSMNYGEGTANDGGIYKINLETLSVTPISQPPAEDNRYLLLYFDGNYVYYRYDIAPGAIISVKGFYKADLNGNNIEEISETESITYIHSNEIWGDKCYYIEENVLYEKKQGRQ